MMEIPSPLRKINVSTNYLSTTVSICSASLYHLSYQFPCLCPSKNLIANPTRLLRLALASPAVGQSVLTAP